MPSDIKWIGIAEVASRARTRLAVHYGTNLDALAGFETNLADALAEGFNLLFTFKRKLDDLEVEVASGAYGPLSVGGTLTDLGRFYAALKQCYDPAWLSQFDVEGNPL